MEESKTVTKRRKIVYELTDKGKKELSEWMEKPVEIEQFRNELLLKLFFGVSAPPSTTRKHVEDFKKMLLVKDKTYRSIRDKLQKEHTNDPGLPYWLMTIDYGIGQVKTALEWCRSSLKQFKKLEGSDA